MFKKIAIALVTLALPLTASANWSLGGGYVNISSDIDGPDVSLGGLYGSAAYKFTTSNSKVSIIPELRLATGISDDTVYGVDIEMERFIALSAKAQYQVNNNIHIFIMPTYANLEIKASANGSSASDDEWEFGFGTGLGYDFNQQSSVIFSYERFDDTDVLSAGFSFKF